MCGIAGIVGAEPGAPGLDAATVHRMCQTLVHRGPDDEGIFVHGRVALGMRRLSIIDIAGGHQPVFNEDRSVCLVFNGEIYNFAELRAELQSRGHHLATHSDTEVIVHLYEDFGARAVDRLRGMFAFALFDEKRQNLLLARDRLGIKPLHYALDRGRLLFGSEIKAILAAAPSLAQTNSSAILEYLHLGYVPESTCALAPIRKLQPGELAEYADGRLTVRRYWDLPTFGTYTPASEDECLRELETRLAEAVRIRLIADVPLGALLSGGVDSSTVVALMAQASSAPVKTFSIGFKQADFDETSFARKVAERFGTDHHELILEPNVVDTVDELSRSLEEPFGDSSMLPTYFVSRLARRHVTVALSGDGGDELFAGYDRYGSYLLRDRDAVPGWAGRWFRQRVFPRLPEDMRGRQFAFNASLPWDERYLETISFLPAFERDSPLVAGDFLAAAANGGDPLAGLRSLLASAPANDPLSRVLYLDTKTYLPGDILTKVDRMSMATSLEVRVPLLDHIFLEWVTSLPATWKMRGPRRKFLLRELARRVGVPDEVLDRPKKGFALPLRHWFRVELKEMIQTILLEPRTLQRGYLEARGVRRMLDEHFRGRRSHWSRIWRLLMLELWHRNFLEPHAKFASAAPQTRVVGPASDMAALEPQPGLLTRGAG